MSDELAKSIASLPPDLLTLFNSLPDPAPNAETDSEAAYSLYNLLKFLDLSIAERWHWKDTRKVADCIIRRFNTLCFWVYAKPDVLKPRLDLRVDRMIEQGLLDEVRALRELTVNDEDQNGGSDYTFGMFQSIGEQAYSFPRTTILHSIPPGYREFHHYLTLSYPTNGDFQTALKNMKTSTRQYAKRQISWLRNKLLPALYNSNEDCKEEEKSYTYLLDATELGDAWDSNVHRPAVRITQGFLNHDSLPHPFSLSETANTILRIEEKPTDPDAVLMARRKIVCPVCTADPARPFMVEEGKEWALHLKTRVHRRRAHKKDHASRIEPYKQRSLEKHGSVSDAESSESEVDLSAGILER
ncbi:tRNA dimethylallyltransferase, mitochondrial [Marasmius crinis-equi]|uniref:tRNA dimethylallyltransferase, mitochondrial n=1 Tax=Marasmius crinis-equi TaxID=585013 RepID=A0ABR3FSG7_9AGAR